MIAMIGRTQSAMCRQINHSLAWSVGSRLYHLEIASWCGASRETSFRAPQRGYSRKALCFRNFLLLPHSQQTLQTSSQASIHPNSITKTLKTAKMVKAGMSISLCSKGLPRCSKVG